MPAVMLSDIDLVAKKSNPAPCSWVVVVSSRELLAVNGGFQMVLILRCRRAERAGRQDFADGRTRAM